MIEVYWYKCKGNIWCELNKIDYKHKNLNGISGAYVLWYDMQTRVIIKVGYGIISEEIEKDINDLAIQAFAKYKPKITWCELFDDEIAPAINYLIMKLNPKIKPNTIPNGKPEEINLPWD